MIGVLFLACLLVPLAVLGGDARAARLSWWCRHGQHAWRVVAITGARTVGADRVGSVTQQCTRPGCPATRHEQNVVLAGGS